MRGIAIPIAGTVEDSSKLRGQHDCLAAAIFLKSTAESCSVVVFLFGLILWFDQMTLAPPDDLMVQKSINIQLPYRLFFAFE